MTFIDVYIIGWLLFLFGCAVYGLSRIVTESIDRGMDKQRNKKEEEKA